MNKLASAALVAALALGPVAAHATVYVGSRNIDGFDAGGGKFLGGVTETLSITIPDYVRGVVGALDITDWTLSVVDGSKTYTATSADPSDANFSILTPGGSLFASATQLTWNFFGDGYLAFRHFSSLPTVEYCLADAFQSESCNNGFVSGEEISIIDPPDFSMDGRNYDFVGQLDGGVVVLGTVRPVPGAVPEPAAWSLLIAGFGLTGAALRRRRANAWKPARAAV